LEGYVIPAELLSIDCDLQPHCESPIDQLAIQVEDAEEGLSIDRARLILSPRGLKAYLLDAGFSSTCLPLFIGRPIDESMINGSAQMVRPCFGFV